MDESHPAPRAIARSLETSAKCGRARQYRKQNLIAQDGAALAKGEASNAQHVSYGSWTVLIRCVKRTL